nr:YetF domain-containing protein [Cytobacillus firmus]
MLGIEFLTLKNKSTRSLLLGDPNIIIRDGIMDRKLLKKNKLDVNQVLSILRQNQVFSVREVKYGILEANGQISILLQSKYQKPDMQDLSLLESPVYLPIRENP